MAEEAGRGTNPPMMFCKLCSMGFDTMDEWLAHRQSKQHVLAVEGAVEGQGVADEGVLDTRACVECGMVFWYMSEDILQDPEILQHQEENPGHHEFWRLELTLNDIAVEDGKMFLDAHGHADAGEDKEKKRMLREMQEKKKRMLREMMQEKKKRMSSVEMMLVKIHS